MKLSQFLELVKGCPSYTELKIATVRGGLVQESDIHDTVRLSEKGVHMRKFKLVLVPENLSDNPQNNENETPLCGLQQTENNCHACEVHTCGVQDTEACRAVCGQTHHEKQESHFSTVQ